MLHAQVSEEAGLLAQLADDLVVHALHLVEHAVLLGHVREVALEQLDLLGRLRRGELLADLLLLLFVHEGLDLVARRGEADAEEDLELVADREVGDLPVECLQQGLLDFCDGGALDGELGLLDEHLDLVLALVLLDVLGSEREAGDRERLPAALLVVLAREAEVDHDGGGVAGARQQVDRLAQFEHPVDQHAALPQVLELASVHLLQ